MLRRGGEVLRALSQRGLADWEQLQRTQLFARLNADGRLVHTERLDPPPALPDLPGLAPAAVLRHERLPFVSYPYEWPFGMLRDAALLQLDILLEALDEGLILKDASPYNVQWRGTSPVFVDVGSFEALREGEVWVGYRQFCMLFLYPLMLRAYKGLPFRPWLRGSLEGITPQECSRLMSARDLLRPGVLTHVRLHSRLDRRHAASARDVRTEVRESGFGSELIRANVSKLRALVQRLGWDPPASTWSTYGATSTYSEQEAEQKARFVTQAVADRGWRLAWDLGSNDGRFARIAADHARYVVAVDADEAVVERSYRALRDEGQEKVLALCVDLADASPGLGWKGAERRPLLERGRPELVLCLALVHHLAITANVPLGEIVGWLGDLGAVVVVEFVGRDDPMAEQLLRNKGPRANPDYSLEAFERLLEERFDVEARQPLAGGRRVLYRAVPKAG